MHRALFWVGVLFGKLALAQSAPTTSLPASSPTSAPSVSSPALVAGRCSDGTLNLNEECDDGNISTGDGCSNACTIERCGDRSVQGGRGETCDDGNSKGGDGCSAACTLEYNRSPLFGFALSAVTTASGIPLSRVLESPLPFFISFGVGPALGHLYMKDYREAALFSGLRAGALGVAGLGLVVAGENFESQNVGDGIPLNAFPGDGSFLLGGLFLVGGLIAYPSISLLDLAVQFNKYSMRPMRFGSLIPAVGPVAPSAFGFSLRATW